MSVAFRRESEEEHVEPKFELPIPPGPNLVTPRGLQLIEQRIADLEERLAATPAGPSADLSQDAARKALQRDLRYWSARRISAELVAVPSGERVEFGVVVTIALRGAEKTFRIVGDDEADPASGTLSFNAPLARAMAGAHPGDFLPFAGEDDAIEVLAITVPA